MAVAPNITFRDGWPVIDIPTGPSARYTDEQRSELGRDAVAVRWRARHKAIELDEAELEAMSEYTPRPAGLQSVLGRDRKKR